jgi:hypothetical protein
MRVIETCTRKTNVLYIIFTIATFEKEDHVPPISFQQLDLHFVFKSEMLFSDHSHKTHD